MSGRGAVRRLGRQAAGQLPLGIGRAIRERDRLRSSLRASERSLNTLRQQESALSSQLEECISAAAARRRQDLRNARSFGYAYRRLLAAIEGRAPDELGPASAKAPTQAKSMADRERAQAISNRARLADRLAARAGGLPGRESGHEHPATAGTDPGSTGDLDLRNEHALVRAGWELVELLGRVGEGESRRLLADRWQAERARAAATLAPLQTGKLMDPGSLSIYEGPSNQTRFRRTLDYLRPGDRVFEVGLGRGYLAGLILRDGGVSAYHGIELEEPYVLATRELVELNGLADRAEVTTGNLYDLKTDQLEERKIDLLVCCEVIEHVPDPEMALKTLAAALPSAADLLISVPLLGRLEGHWEHIAIFDAPRTRAMVERTGLVIHAVDVVDNTWVFVLASHDQHPSARAADAAALVTDAVATAPATIETPRSVQPIDLASAIPSVWNKRLAFHRISHDPGGLVCEMTGEGDSAATETPYGGIRIPVNSPRGLRVELALHGADHVTGFFVDAYAGDERVARWKWDPASSRPAIDPATFVMRPGRRGRYFRPAGLGAIETADAFDLFVALKPGASVRFRITQAATIL